jgi:hypothetical protein
MSKIKKESIKKPISNKKDRNDESFAFKTIIRSTILSGAVLLVSILLNGEIFNLFTESNQILSIIDISIKVGLILIFFVLMIISIGNYKELSGKPLSFKEIFFLFILSVIQGFRNPYVFTFSFFGLLFLLVYFFVLQE